MDNLCSNVLFAAIWRRVRELAGMSVEDTGNTLIVEISNCSGRRWFECLD